MWKKFYKYAIPLTICLVLVATMIIAVGCEEETTTASQPTTSQPTTSEPTTSEPTTSEPTPTCTPPEQDEILIGASRDITGPQAGFQEYGFAPLYKAWAEEINAAGGLDVCGKKLPIRIIEYDDASDPAVCTRNLEKLITQDNVDFLFGPTGTAMLFSAAPIANKYNKIMLCGEGGATTLEPKLKDMPYVFSVLNYSNHFQIPVFADLIEEKGAQTIYICYMNDLHGAEYRLTAQSEFEIRGMQVLQAKSIPMTITDMDPIVKEAKELNPDVFCMFAYPNQNILFMNTAIALDFSPNCILIGPGCNFEFFNLMYGASLEGVCGEGAWCRNSSPELAAFADKVTALVGMGNQDWWGANVYQAQLEYLQQAIQMAGTLDNDAILEIYRTTHFQTLIGDMWWDIQGENGGGLLPQECYSGQIGQWQNGIFEVIDDDEHNTAPFIYPKPPWPAPAEE